MTTHAPRNEMPIVAVLPSPVGDVHVAVHASTLCALELREDRLRAALARHHPQDAPASGDVGAIASRLTAWFAGDLAALDAIEIEGAGTVFQRQVWAALRAIAPGQTVTYGELARSLGPRVSPRAVGRACGSNPFAIVVPCHRVVGAGGDLTGYAGGLSRKRWLLDHERRWSGGRTAA